MQIFLVLCHAFSFSNVTRRFASTGYCLVCADVTDMGYKTNSGTYIFLKVGFLHGLMRKPVEWQYAVNLKCCLPLLQKYNDISQIISSLWKVRNNKIRMMSLQDRIEPVRNSNREGLIIWKSLLYDTLFCIRELSLLIPPVNNFPLNPLYYKYPYW